MNKGLESEWRVKGLFQPKNNACRIKKVCNNRFHQAMV